MTALSDLNVQRNRDGHRSEDSAKWSPSRRRISMAIGSMKGGN